MERSSLKTLPEILEATDLVDLELTKTNLRASGWSSSGSDGCTRGQKKAEEPKEVLAFDVNPHLSD